MDEQQTQMLGWGEKNSREEDVCTVCDSAPFHGFFVYCLHTVWTPLPSPLPSVLNCFYFSAPAAAAAVLLLQGSANVLENQRQPRKEGISCAYWSCWKWLKGDLCWGWGGTTITAFDLSLSVCYEKEVVVLLQENHEVQVHWTPTECLPRRELEPI